MPESKKAAGISGLVAWYGAPGEIRTPDPQVRSLVLYPTELRAQKRNYEGPAIIRQLNLYRKFLYYRNRGIKASIIKDFKRSAK